jgi:carbon-monoxide dehydrogenase medium subunit
MIKKFSLFEPRSIRKLLILLDQQKANAMLVAGGTNLLVDMKKGLIAPPALVSLQSISKLNRLSYSPKSGLRLGAMTTIHEIEVSPIIKKYYPCLREAASQLGSYQVRNLATVGGNLCHASPAGDMITPLMALGASVRLESIRGQRLLPIEKFFKGPGKTVLKPGECLLEILVPVSEPNTYSAFVKYSRREVLDLAIVNLAACIRVSGGSCEDLRIFLGAVGPTVIRAHHAESVLKGCLLQDSLIKSAGNLVANEIRPISDIRASAEYRREVSRVIIIRVLKDIMKGRTFKS